jgi:hypothetical protein
LKRHQSKPFQFLYNNKHLYSNYRILFGNMRFAIVTSVLILLAAASPVEQTSANPAKALLGINCRGSGFCSGNSVAFQLYQYINGAPDNRQYNNGFHIACTKSGKGGICAFLQGTKGGQNGAQVKALASEIVKHGCNVCGSVPITFPKSNDPKDGILTFNYVKNTDNPCPPGLCA